MRNYKYQDFLPEEAARQGLFGGVDYAGLDSCLEALNHWLERNPVDVQRVETVVLPNIHGAGEEGPTDTELHTAGHAAWYQFLRLWYLD